MSIFVIDELESQWPRDYGQLMCVAADGKFLLSPMDDGSSSLTWQRPREGSCSAPMTLELNQGNPFRLTYGITPPKISFDEERRRTIAELQIQRIAPLGIDALVVYDLQDESSRTDAVRPFPFLQSIDPLDYAYEYLEGIPQKKIVYRSITGQTEASLSKWLRRLEEHDGSTVFVGAPSQSQKSQLKLSEAYEVHRRETPHVPLGGVMIAERHETTGSEVDRMLRKVERGCSFFVSQAVYSLTASKNVISDLYFQCQREERSVPSLVVTLSPCGSEKTLEFMNWLGVSVPRWLRNELIHANDILEKSVNLSISAFEELYDFSKSKGIELGCNVESVSLRKAEIDASVEMVHQVSKILGR